MDFVVTEYGRIALSDHCERRRARMVQFVSSLTCQRHHRTDDGCKTVCCLLSRSFLPQVIEYQLPRRGTNSRQNRPQARIFPHFRPRLLIRCSTHAGNLLLLASVLRCTQRKFVHGISSSPRHGYFRRCLRKLTSARSRPSQQSRDPGAGAQGQRRSSSSQRALEMVGSDQRQWKIR